MNRPIAIVNCRIVMPEGELPSGAILVVGGEIRAAGEAQTIALSVNALLIDALQGVISVGDADAAGAPVEPGRPANLVCHTRFGDLAWVMEVGVIVHPPNAAPPPAPRTWAHYREETIAKICDFLEQRPETQHVQRTDAIPGYQKRGVDIVWRFRNDREEAQSLTIRAVPSLDDRPDSIFILDGPSARKLPTAALSQTRAHWWFYHHFLDDAFYCVPVVDLKRWMNVHAKEIPPTRVHVAGVSQTLQGRAILVERLRRDIKRTRIIPL